MVKPRREAPSPAGDRTLHRRPEQGDLLAIQKNSAFFLFVLTWLPQMPAIEACHGHGLQVEIIQQPRIDGNLWPGEIGSIFTPRTTHLIVSTTSANATIMMLVGGFVAGIDRCPIAFNKTDIFGRIVSPQHAALETKSTIAFRYSRRRLTYFELCRAAVATGFDGHHLNPP